MRILNVRHGFACNSSSSHSVVFFDPVTRPRFDHHKADDFGWGNFTLASKEAKRRYAFSAVMTAASSIIRARMEANGNPHPGWELNDTKRLAWEAEERRLMFEVLKHYGWTEDTVPPYTDHQSVLTVPSTFDGHGLLTPFVERFIKFFERDDVTVLGGNDNDYSHPLAGQFKKELLRLLPREQRMRGRFDKTHFVLFDDHSGMKLRVAFDEDVTETLPGRALTPELVDVKLTDYCTMGCTYCYQGSTTKGRHAPTAQVMAILEALAGNRVFEIAFGGGEPTEHPDFIEILKHTRKLKMVPNFTTRNIDFLVKHRDLLFDFTHPLIGAVAISIDNATQMQHAGEKLCNIELRTSPNGDTWAVARGSVQHAAADRIQWQVVHGALSTEELLEIHRSPYRIFRPVLLLGWKTTGRGSSVAPVVCDWEKVLQQEPDEDEDYTLNPTLNDPTKAGVKGAESLYIDTEFQRQFGNRLRELGAIPETMGAPEGTYSMYVDAVNGVLGPSSYCEKKLMRPFEPFPSREFIREAWDMLSVDGGEKWAQGGLL